MFYGCGSLTALDLSDWDVSNATNMYHMFADCFQMTDYDFTGWNTAKVTDVNGMFNSNRALQSVDLSDFDVQNIVTFAQFFDGCTALEQVIGLDQWNTASMQKMGEMFNGCSSLRTLDLSAFDTSKLFQTDRTFYNCSGLTTIYVGDGWDMSNVTTHPDMFTGCSSIVGGNGTVYSTANTGVAYACVDTVEHPGYLTYKAPATTNP
jgi:surface protein